MKNIKIGKITLSFIFISLGIVIFLDKFSHYRLMDSLSILWPVVILFFGLENIYAAFSKKAEYEQRSELGIASMIFISLFVITLAAITTTQTSQYPNIKKAINTRLQYKYKDDISEEIVLNKCRKLVIDDSNVDIIINKSDNEKIKIKLVGFYRHNDEKNIKSNFKFLNVDEYMSTSRVSRNIKNQDNSIKKIKLEGLKYLIYLPKDIDIEVINRYGDVLLDLDGNENNIDIHCLYGDVSMKFSDNQTGKFNIVATYGNIYDEIGFDIIESASTSSINEVRKSLGPVINVRTNNGDVKIETD